MQQDDAAAAAATPLLQLDQQPTTAPTTPNHHHEPSSPPPSKLQKLCETPAEHITTTTTTMITIASPPPLLALLPSPPPREPSRCYFAQQQELQFIGIFNDGSDENSLLLVKCKALFSQQLPKMPKEYILRLLFDRSHQTICCLNAEQELIGAISVKPFAQSHFFEIAFLAVSGTHQVRGVGSLLMNHLKEFAKLRGYTHFLTYADNFAVGYFKKQGFSTTLSLPRERWFGLIKDYDGGTLMECKVFTDVDNLHIKQLVSELHARYIHRMLMERPAPTRVYPPLAPGAVEIHDAYADLPGILEAGWEKPSLDSPTLSNATRVALLQQLQGEELKQAMLTFHDRILANAEASWPFLEPVPLDVVVDYLLVIKTPVDLQVVRKRIETGNYYTSAAQVRSDLQLIADNCLTYNRPDTTYYKAALALQELCIALFGDLPFEKQQVLADKHPSG